MFGLPNWVWVLLVLLLIIWLIAKSPRERVSYVGLNHVNELLHSGMSSVTNAATTAASGVGFSRFGNDFDDIRWENEITSRNTGSETPKLSSPRNSIESHGERECRRVFEHIFGRPFPNVRPDFMRNPLTGRNLELDGYNAELSLAFERNGAQHVNSKGQDDETYLKQVRRDIIKHTLADIVRVHLITIPHSVAIRDIEDYVRIRIPESLGSYVVG
jgi:hypothetical protein